MVRKTFMVMLLIYSLSVFGQLRIVCTAALVSQDYDLRKSEYIESVEKLSALGCGDPYIVEATKGSGPNFFDNYSKNVFYSRAQDFGVKDIRNKGINESRTLLDGLIYFNFDPEDMILKLTGRYFLKSDHIINIIKNNPDVDAVVKVIRGGSWVLTGCYAMRCCYFVDMLKHLDYDEMEKDFVYIEVKVAEYLKRAVEAKKMKVLYIEELGVTARIIAEGISAMHEL